MSVTRSAAMPLETLGPGRRLVISGMAFLTVVDLFATQAILPSLAQHYAVSPAAAGLAVNACTLGMAIAGLAIALFGRQIDRRLGIVASLAALAVPTALLALAPDLVSFAVLRVLQGLCMATAFSLTLAYLGEEHSAAISAGAFAAYITGNVASNLVGRLVSASVVDHAGLSANFLLFAALNLAGAVLAYGTIHGMAPAVPAPARGAESSATAMMRVTHPLANPRLLAGFTIGFCILFAFIGVFTYVNFVLVRPPLALGMMSLGLVYFVFLPSVITTALAGGLVARLGTRAALRAALTIAMLGLPLLLAPWLVAVMLGMVLVAIGTFLAQAVATGAVSHAAGNHRAAASGLYLASYFLGGLAGSLILGQLFDAWGWPACVAGVGLALAVAASFSGRLAD